MNTRHARRNSISRTRFQMRLQCSAALILLVCGNAYAQGSTFVNALLFDGNEDYVTVGSDATLILTDSLTIEAWVSPTGPGSGPDGAGGIVVNKEGEYELARFSDGTIRWALANTNPGWVFVDTQHVIPENEWVHLAVVYDLTTITTYANGDLVHVLSGSGSIGDFHPGEEDFRIGGRQNQSQSFDGLIDEVRIWNVARTQSEIQVTMNDTLSAAYYATPDSGLVGYWRLDKLEDLGVNSDGIDDVRDLSVNTNHGDLVGEVSLRPSGVAVGTDEQADGIPRNLTLGKNYPNPVQSVTTITFGLPESVHATLTIYDVLGREVAVLVSSALPAGPFRATWDAASVPSGIYVYRLEASNFAVSRKLIVLAD